MLKYDFMKYRHRLLYYLHQVYLIYHKKENKTYKFIMLPKWKFICMLKRKFCVASFRLLTSIILSVFTFFSFTPALKALVSAKNFLNGACRNFMGICIDLKKENKTQYHANIDIFLIDSQQIKYLDYFLIKIIPCKRI
jgi:hypothetical protein